MGLPLDSQLAFDVRIGAKGGAQHVDAMLVARQSPIANPNKVAAVQLQATDVRGLFADSIPDPRFGRIEADKRVPPKIRSWAATT